MTTILKNTTIAGTGHLTLPVGNTSQRPTINTTTIRWTNTGTQAYSILAGSTPTLSATNWTAPTGVTSVEVLVIAGGGGGGSDLGGGGGAGGLIYNSNFSVTPGTAYTVTVGAGGAGGGAVRQSNSTGTNGSNSIFGSLTAIGGGGGGAYWVSDAAYDTGKNGGSGGGNGGRDSTIGTSSGNGTAGQGYNGGLQGTVSAYSGGGGGGAGGPGSNGAGALYIPGGGGSGLNFSISGTATWYAGGGGGSNYHSTSANTFGGAGGIGGGGAGGYNVTSPQYNGIAGTASTGGGGGGGSWTGSNPAAGGSGGSGVVVLRYSSLTSGNTTTGLARYNTDLRDIELYEGVGTGWQAQDTFKNFSLYNVMSYSEQANLWSLVNTVVSANSIANPLDGVSTADKLAEAADTNQYHYMLQYYDVPARSTWCASVYVKAAGRTSFRIGFSNYTSWFGGGGNETRFNLSTGVASPTNTATPLAYGMIDVGNGWYRCYTVGQNATDYAVGSNFVIYIEDGSQSVTYNGDGTSGFYVYGMQMESDVLFPSTYTKTDSIKMPRPTSLGGYRTHTYTAIGTTSFTPAVSGTVEVLVVAGGGAGGNNHGGGGGAGGLVYKTNYPVISGRSYPVTVGAGGVAAGTGVDNNTNGGNSGFGTIIAVGGGAGGNRNDSANTSPGQSGGSGGGGGGSQATFPNNWSSGAGTFGQGNSGGIGRADSPIGGGGGGAGAPGRAPVAGGGQGGAGLRYSISGTPTYYAGGGSGSTGGVPGLAGGLGGGGTAGTTVGTSGTAGTANTGGGGGGGGAGNTVGSNGGSGIVIVRYRYG